MLIAVFMLAGTTASYAQLTKEQIKERKEMRKLTKKELSEKASKLARKEATNLKKEGWSENTVSNKQLEAEEAASVVQSISAGKNLITQSIGRVIPVVEVYRTKANKNKEVLVRLAYNAKMAKAAAKAAVREDLEKRGDDLQKKLDDLLGW